ncbi:unnamed protein product, partial [Mesorhabditis spiculigera]
MEARVLSYTASKTFSRKMNLPDRRNWSVCAEDVLFEHEAVIYTKSKGILFDYYNDIIVVPTILTTQGFLIIYASVNTGYIVHVPSASMIQTTTDVDKDNVRCTHVKLRYPFGNVHLCAADGLGAHWRNLLTAAHDNRIQDIVAAKKAAHAPAKPLMVKVAEEVEDKEPESEDESEQVSTSSSSLSDVNEPKYDLVARLNKPPQKSEEGGEAMTAIEKQASAISWTCTQAPEIEDVRPPPVKCDASTNVSGTYGKLMETLRETKERLIIRRWTKAQPTKSTPAVTEPRTDLDLLPIRQSETTISSNSGIFSDITDMEPSCCQRSEHNVPDLRGQFESKLTVKKSEEKLKIGFPRRFNITSKRAVANQLSVHSLTDVKDWYFGPGADQKPGESRA